VIFIYKLVFLLYDLFRVVVEMIENKQILKYCPNFYQIINFNPISGDEITGKIIRMYKDFVFRTNINDEESVIEVKELDAAIAKYINDYSFRTEVQKQILSVKVKNDCKDIIKFFMDIIIKVFSTWEEYTTRVIYISRWI
jgi:hypothetical protein